MSAPGYHEIDRLEIDGDAEGLRLAVASLAETHRRYVTLGPHRQDITTPDTARWSGQQISYAHGLRRRHAYACAASRRVEGDTR